MTFKEAAKLLDGIPHIEPKYGKILYDFVLESRCENVLELGFAHGTSTCYMAAALQELEAGQIITIDNQSAKYREPDIFTLLEKAQLREFVKPIFAHSSYNWELMRLIEYQSKTGVCEPLFDFCFIDGAHSWETDGFAFFLVDRLLKPGGWILFDDIYWTFGKSSIKDSEEVKAMSDEEKSTPQIEKVFSLLVCQHPGYQKHRIYNEWGWAQKVCSLTNDRNSVEELYLRQDVLSDIKSLLKKIAFRFL